MRMWRVLLPVILLLAASSAKADCTGVATSNLIFGTYAGEATVTATITANCSSGFSYAIGINGGDTGQTSARSMAGNPAGSHLSYQIYQDSARSVPWGDNFGVDTISATGTGSNQTFTLYGRLPAGQNVIPGNYADHLLAYVQSGPSSSFTATALVNAGCSVAAGNLNFGTYFAEALYGNSTLTIACTQTTGWEIGLDAGTSAGATTSTRAMTGPSGGILSYSLFQSNNYTQVWGMTSGSDTVTGTGTGFNQALTVYGRIPAGIYIASGSYSDTITVTVTY